MPTKRLPKNAYYEISISFQKLSLFESLKIWFMEEGIPGEQIILQENKKENHILFYSRSHKTLLKLKKQFQKSQFKSCQWGDKLLLQEDWLDKWKEDYQAKNIGQYFRIVPEWLAGSEMKVSQKRIPIILDPGSAFGSGYHETTRLMVRGIELLRGKFNDFLDIGCGTGVLSVAAAHMGANYVEGFDHDKASSINASKNFERNSDLKNKFFCGELAGFKSKNKFSLVGANTISKVLENYQMNIQSSVKKGGYLLISGIYKDNYSLFRKKFKTSGFRCLRVFHGKEWKALIFKKL